MSNDIIQVTVSPTPIIQVVQQPTQVISVTTAGPQGPPGSSSAVVLTQPTAASQWYFTHALGRRPGVTVYDASGNIVIADVAATSTDITITLANAGTGSIVLT